MIGISRQLFKIQNGTHIKSACVKIVLANVLAFYDNIILKGKLVGAKLHQLFELSIRYPGNVTHFLLWRELNEANTSNVIPNRKSSLLQR